MVNRISYIYTFFISLLIVLWPYIAVAENKEERLPTAQFKELLNRNTVTIITGSLSGTYLKFADDMLRALGDGNNFRILPVRGTGGAGNIRDVMYLRGIDMGFVKADALEAFRGQRYYENISRHLTYIARMYNEEIHFLADDKINSIDELQGKVVAFHGNGSLKTGLVVLDKLGIKPRKVINLSIHEAASRMKSGEVDAIIRVTGKPFRGASRVKRSNIALRILPIPYRKELHSRYLPAKLSYSDYPDFIKEGDTVLTIAVSAILVAYNWKKDTDRYRRLEMFVNVFFSNFNKILERKSSHKKWKEVNLAGNVQGWTRFAPAQEWLDRRKQGTSVEQVSDSKLLQEFQKYIVSTYGQKGKIPKNFNSKQHIKKFLKWKETQEVNVTR